jgi:hypothetical protein
VTTRTYLDFIGRDKTQKAFASVSNSVGNIEKKFGLAKAAVGLFGLAAAGGLAASAKETIDYADRVGKLADRMGSSAEALSQLEFVAERSGVGFDFLTKSMEKSSDRAAEAAAKGGASAAVFDELGISAGKLAKLSPEAQLLALADAFNDVESPADRTRLAMDLWGKSGAEMLQITQAGSGGITELMEQADSLGRTLTTGTAKGAADANDGLTNLASVGRAFNLSLARYLGPTIGKVATALGEWIPKAVFAASKRIVELRATVLGVIGKIVGGLSKVYGVLGKLPGWLGESYRDAEASAKKFAAEMTDLGELYRVEAEGMTFETREFSAAIQDADEVAGVHNATVRALAGGTKAAAAAQRESVEATKASTLASQAATKVEAERARQQEQWSQAVKRVEEETRTPHEVYKARIEELIELQSHGLGNEAFARAVVQAQEGVAVAAETAGASLQATEAVGAQAASNLQSSFASFLFDPFEAGVGGMVDSFTQALRQMAADAAAKQLFGSFGGGGGGGFGGLLGKAFSAIGLQSGGPMVPGLATPVGEAGLEYAVAQRPARIYPRSAASGVTINNNITVNGGGGDRRSTQQLQAAVGEATARALRRNR